MITKKNNKKEKATELLSAVPYQLCPKCNGEGMLFVQNRSDYTTSVISGSQVCDVCNGNKIIPMHVMSNANKVLHIADVNSMYSAEKVLEMLENCNDIEDAKDLFRENWIE